MRLNGRYGFGLLVRSCCGFMRRYRYQRRPATVAEIMILLYSSLFSASAQPSPVLCVPHKPV
jgi:hypothetical protein